MSLETALLHTEDNTYTRILDIIRHHGNDNTEHAKAAFRAINANARPYAATLATEQKIFGIVDAAMSVFKERRDPESYTFPWCERLEDVRQLCQRGLAPLN